LDDFGYNLYTFNLSGPIIPGDQNNTMFLSAERGWFLDADPSSVERTYYYSLDPLVTKTTTAKESNDASDWRFTGRTSHTFGDFRLNLGANV